MWIKGDKLWNAWFFFICTFNLCWGTYMATENNWIAAVLQLSSFVFNMVAWSTLARGKDEILALRKQHDKVMTAMQDLEEEVNQEISRHRSARIREDKTFEEVFEEVSRSLN